MRVNFIVFSILLGFVAFVCAESCVRSIYANDPYFSSVSLKDGFAGSTSQNYRPYNRDSALSYNIYYNSQFTLSPQGSDRAAFVDLGTEAEFGRRFNTSLILGNTAYSSIHVDRDSKVLVYASSDVYNKDNRKAFQPFGSEVTAPLQNFQSGLAATFYPQVGHIYLLNIYNSQYGETYLTKMIVLDVSPNNATVIIRWDVIDSTASATFSSPCFISLDTSPTGSNLGSNDSPALGYMSPLNALVIALSVILPVIFVMVVLIGVFVIVLFKKMKQITGFASYSTPTPKVEEKKPLIQK